VSTCSCWPSRSICTSPTPYQVAAAEVGDENLWQRARLGFAAVSNSQQHTTEVIDRVSRFVWSFPEIAVIDEERTWLS
jgi:uncharacterized protein YlxP (DUF503 family)